MFRNLKIRTRLAIVVLVPVLALSALAAIGYRTLYSSRIGSLSYDNIVEAKDLVADVLPPPQYIIEPYVIALELVDETDPAAIDERAARLADLEAVFVQRNDVWAEALDANQPLRAELADNANASGRAFFEALDARFLPAVRAGDLATAREVLDTELVPAYDAHRESIDRVVVMAREQVTFYEDYADDLVDERSIQLLIALAAVALLIVVISTLIARSIIRPVRQLTAAAERAEAALPAAVAALHDAPAGTAPTPLPPVEVDAGSEFASLAGALTQMQTTAVNLAAEQAQTRHNVSAMLANLARRNQSLLNRTLSFISQLEEHERDPEALENLFKLDHLATRMRRNAESLLVLAGSDTPRTWPRPIEVTEIVRAALSEIEAYDRVELNQVDTVWVRGTVVSDLTHLLAELLDNATRFSPPTTTVTVVGRLTDKGYIVSVTDQGMGMSSDDLARANAELQSISRPEERSTMVLGLAVVGRLAARSGIQVRLSESPFEGVTAQIRVPLELLQTPTAEPSHAPAAMAPTAPPVRPASATPSPPAFPYAPAPDTSSAPAASPAPPTPPTPSGLPTRTPAAAPLAAPVGVAAPAPTAVPPPPPTPVPAPAAPVAPAAAPAPMAAPAPVTASAPPPPPPVPTTPGGLVQRVRGANLFESGPSGDLPPPPPVDRSPEAIRDALSSFQYGSQRRPTTPPRRDQEDT